MMRYFLAVVILCAVALSELSAVKVEPAGGSGGGGGAKGGCGPGCVALFIGPRVGLEMNEGNPVEMAEWLRLIWIGVLINDYQAFQQNGCVGCLLENFLGPRVGRQYHYRNVRVMEWIQLVVSTIPQLIMAFEAYQGKTMSEIESQEHLGK